MVSPKTFNFTAPTPYSAEAERIERDRRLAEALMQQGQEPLPTGSMAGAYFVPTNPLQHLAQALKGVSGRMGQRQADEQQKALGERYQADLVDTLRRARLAQSGTPGSTETIMDETAAGGEGQLAQINAPAVPGSEDAANAIYMGHPATQALGMEGMRTQQQMAMLRRALGGQSPGGQNPMMPGPGASVMAGHGGLPPLELLGAGPAGQAVFKTLADRSKPTDKMRELLSRGIQPGSPQWNAELGMHFNQGGAWQIGQDGNVNLAPGYAQGAGAIRREEAGAAAEFQMVPGGVNIPGVGVVPMTLRQQAMQAAQAHPSLNTPQAAPQPGPQQPAPTGFAPVSSPGFTPMPLQGMKASLQGIAPTEEAAIEAVKRAAQQGRTGTVMVSEGQPVYKTDAEKEAERTTNEAERAFTAAIAGGVAKDVVTGAQNARSALGTINTVNQLRGALDSGRVIAGPGATARVLYEQLSQVLNISGADATEKLVKTRSAIQSMAQLELDAAQQMKGQGQITEAERAIIRRAASGDIDGMTVPELRTLTGILDRAARFKIRQNAENVKRMRGNQTQRQYADFLDVPEPPAYGASPESMISDRARAYLEKYAPQK